MCRKRTKCKRNSTQTDLYYGCKKNPNTLSIQQRANIQEAKNGGNGIEFLCSFLCYGIMDTHI